jgi:uncharacterized membrane protein
MDTSAFWAYISSLDVWLKWLGGLGLLYGFYVFFRIAYSKRGEEGEMNAGADLMIAGPAVGMGMLMFIIGALNHYTTF